MTDAGTRGYVANVGSNTMSVVDLEAREVLEHVPVGEGPEWIALHPDERHLYVANREGDDLRVLGLERDPGDPGGRRGARPGDAVSV